MPCTTISSRGLDLIKSFEGFRAAPYMCPAMVPTIGYGATYYENGTRVKMTDPPISDDRAESLLRTTLTTYEKAVDSMTRDDISQLQFDALVSFAFNLGVNALRGSTLLKKVNTNPGDPAIAAEFAKWVNGGGKKLPGLVRRREAESKLYFS
jgi:lysozyme